MVAGFAEAFRDLATWSCGGRNRPRVGLGRTPGRHRLVVARGRGVRLVMEPVDCSSRWVGEFHRLARALRVGRHSWLGRLPHAPGPRRRLGAQMCR